MCFNIILGILLDWSIRVIIYNFSFFIWNLSLELNLYLVRFLLNIHTQCCWIHDLPSILLLKIRRGRWHFSLSSLEIFILNLAISGWLSKSSILFTINFELMDICCFLIQYSTDNYGDKSLGWLPEDFPVGFIFDLNFPAFLFLGTLLPFKSLWRLLHVILALWIFKTEANIQWSFWINWNLKSRDAFFYP